MLLKQITFSDLPKEYKIAIAQHVLFTYPVQKDYCFLIAGGGPLDFAAWLNIKNFFPSKLKDIDLTFKVEHNQSNIYYENIIEDINKKIKHLYQLDKCLSKIGNFDGTVPPTSQFTFDQQTCMRIINSDIFPTLPHFIQTLIKLVSEYEGVMECRKKEG
jgi:hypothetical protein